ncbi:hypothetical protein PIB30_075509 [Stylosanthes scabra]|uniref:Uncharacterized protein n=1 Tax=Stylosanthes scabra TaxID=79078 RepID=A0ABU6VNG5_9FABA|nr:hypothetical protein [Stylosanthes scabra]
MKKKRIRRRTPPRKRCLLFLALWMKMLMRTIYSTWKSFDVISSTLSSILVRGLINIPSTMHNLRLSMLAVSPDMIFPVFGRLQLVRVSKVPHPLLDNKRLRLSTCRKSGCYKSEPKEGPEEEKEKSKETSDTQPMGASTELEFLRFLTSGQQPMCSFSGNCPSINSRNLSQISGLPSSTRSFHSDDLSRVWSSSSTPSH